MANLFVIASSIQVGDGTTLALMQLCLYLYSQNIPAPAILQGLLAYHSR